MEIKSNRNLGCVLKKIKKEESLMSKMEKFQIPPPSENRKEWVQPCLVVYGDMTTLTQQSCNPNLPNCKPKVLGMGDDFSNNISTLT
jgi:hypothetical protein